MENFMRYKKINEKSYNKKGLSYWMMRYPADKVLIPYLQDISGKSILEAGIGYGYYKDFYFGRNTVTGYDVNPALGKNLGIEIIPGKADEIGTLGKKFDRIHSFFMSEYLNKTELSDFIHGSFSILNWGGVFTTTIILNSYLGWIYTHLARLKGIHKFGYSLKEIKELCAGMDYKIIPLRTFFKIPFAVLLEIQKK